MCAEACPQEGTLIFYRGKLAHIDRGRCSGCMACAEACPSDGIKQWGKVMTVEACMKEIRRDMGYYERSGGGVTVSGGEPLLQSGFTAGLLKACKEEGIHTCCESTFYPDWKEIQKVLPYTDLFISDLKHMNPEIHKRYTGASNKRILENLKRLTEEDRDLILRIPVIPGVNDDRANIEASADFILRDLRGRIRTLQLLSFMRLGEEKYASLDMPYEMEQVKLNRRSFQKHVNEIAEYFNSRGIHCLVGTREKED